MQRKCGSKFPNLLDFKRELETVEVNTPRIGCVCLQCNATVSLRRSLSFCEEAEAWGLLLHRGRQPSRPMDRHTSNCGPRRQFFFRKSFGIFGLQPIPRWPNGTLL